MFDVYRIDPSHTNVYRCTNVKIKTLGRSIQDNTRSKLSSSLIPSLTNSSRRFQCIGLLSFRCGTKIVASVSEFFVHRLCICHSRTDCGVHSRIGWLHWLCGPLLKRGNSSSGVSSQQVPNKTTSCYRSTDRNTRIPIKACSKGVSCYNFPSFLPTDVRGRNTQRVQN